MTTTAKILVVAIAAAAALGAGLAHRAAAPAGEVVKLERVVIVGKRADTTVVARLPRVVIEGRRTVDVTVASAEPAARKL